MATQRWIFFPLATAMMAVLAGCSSGSSGGTATTAPAVTIAFSPAAPASVSVGFSINLTAVVANDPNNYGVDWNVTCPDPVGGSCGTLAPLHTASGAPATYTPPSPLPQNALAGVNIVAFATATHVVNVVAPIAVGAFDTSLKAGNYVLQAQGSQAGIPYQLAGVVTLDGQGNVTAGEQVVNNSAAFPSVSAPDTVSTTVPSNYFVGADGRGTMTINTTSGQQEIFALVVPNNSQNPQALISQTGIDTTGASATGTMDLQTSTAAPLGSYVFVSSGNSQQFVNVLKPTAFGGVLAVDAQGNVAGVADEVFAKVVYANNAAISGTVTPVPQDQFGAVTFNLKAPFGRPTKPIVSLQLTGYVVDATHIKLIENDQTAANVGFGTTAGFAIGQGNAAGAFTAASFAGTYVFGVTGTDLSPQNSGYIPSTLTSAGLFATDGAGCQNPCSGQTDTFLLFDNAQNPLSQSGAQLSGTFDATYPGVAANGRVMVSLGHFTLTPPPLRHASYSPTLFFYLTGAAGGADPAALVVAAGDTTAGSSYYPSVGSGTAYLQSTAAPVFTGDYATSFTQESGGTENDGTAQMNANAANTPAVFGAADSALAPPPGTNFGDTTPSDHVFSGNFTSPQANGILPGDLGNSTSPQGNGVALSVGGNILTNQFAVNYYIIDQDRGFWVETDLVNSAPPATPPAPSGQVSFGYYAARTPVCAGCP